MKIAFKYMANKLNNKQIYGEKNIPIGFLSIQSRRVGCNIG